MTVRRWDLPAGEYTQEEAASALNALMADAKGDGQHPLNDKVHPQHADAWRGAVALQALAEPGSPPAEPLTDDEVRDVQAEIGELQSMPGYVSGELKRANRKEHDQTLARLTLLYKMLAEADASASAPADDEVNMGDASS